MKKRDLNLKLPSSHSQGLCFHQTSTQTCLFRTGLIYIVIGLGITIGFATLTERFLEAPINSFKERFPYRVKNINNSAPVAAMV
jgi:peptidoglycan/LPS O-acetylase OafA/YrhL